jgi:hypothetical protein
VVLGASCGILVSPVLLRVCPRIKEVNMRLVGPASAANTNNGETDSDTAIAKAISFAESTISPPIICKAAHVRLALRR